MNPFGLAGPGFLLFYAVFAAIVIVVFAWLEFARGETGPPRLSELTADPYSIAYMRGGAAEAVSVAVMNLVDRGLLTVEGEQVRAAKNASTDFVRRPLDRAILEACATLYEPHLLHHVPAVAAACKSYEGVLTERSLLPDRNKLRKALLVVIALLAGLAVLRIGQALARGQTNLVFLVLLSGVACLVAWRVSARRLTTAGREALASLRTLTQRLQRNATQLRAGGATNEAVLLAAVYGIHALPSAFDASKGLFRQRKKSDGSCSSSCGSSCGSGSSCGGGGSSGCGGCGGGGGD